MADPQTGLAVKSFAAETVRSRLVDTGGTNEAAISAAGRISVDASGVAVPITDNAGSLTVDAPVGTPVFVRLSDGAATLVGQKTMANSLPVTIASDQSALAISAASLPLPSGAATAANQTNVQIVDNAAFTDGTTTVGMAGFVFDETAGTALTENDAAAARVDSKRAQVLVLEDATTRGQRAVVTASNALKVDGSAATQPVSGTVTANAGTGTFGTNLAQVGGNTVVTGGVNGTLGVGGVFAHDAAAATALPVGIGFFASAAAPTDVSADGDSVKAWALRNGSVVVNLASGGTLLTAGQKAMTASFPVVLASDQSAVASNITQVGGATQSATNGLSTRLTDGTAYLANLGQTAATAWFQKITDGTNTAAIIATINALKADIASVVGAVPSATNALPVRLTDGSTFYSASGTAAAFTAPKVSTVTSAALGAGSAVDLDFTAITTATTGQLVGVDATAAVPLKIEIKTVNAGTPTTRAVLFLQNSSNVQWRAPHKSFITQAGGATSRFRATVTNRDTTQASDVYATGYWDEV
jgi:hypothetical protein